MTAPRILRSDIEDVTRVALCREAEARLAAGDRLVRGVWLTAAEARRAQRGHAWRAARGTVEALILWSVVAAAGLAGLALITAIL